MPSPGKSRSTVAALLLVIWVTQLPASLLSGGANCHCLPDCSGCHCRSLSGADTIVVPQLQAGVLQVTAAGEEPSSRQPCPCAYWRSRPLALVCPQPTKQRTNCRWRVNNASLYAQQLVSLDENLACSGPSADLVDIMRALDRCALLCRMTL